MTTRHLDEEAIFNVARKIETQDARDRYLQQICGADQSLLKRVTALLRAYDDETKFLEQPAAKVTATFDARSCGAQVGTIIGPYKLLEQIGEGGMGLVYMAEQRQPIRRKVALKIIKPGMDSQAVIVRFEAERQALAMMDHPNIARILDAGATESGRPYFVMELVKGVPVTNYCDGCHLTIHDRLELFDQICKAVNHAHERGIIHRDIKPSNVLIEMQDGRAAPKIIDFGVAKAVGTRLTEQSLMTGFGQMLGTPLYMSPEQAELGPLDVDTRSDIYSLGVLLYELVTGTTPFKQERIRTSSFDELRQIIREEDPPRPSTRLSTIGKLVDTIAEKRRTEPHRLCRRLRGDLDWIVMKALEKDPRRRYQSASELATDVQRHLDDRPVEARPPSLIGHIVKWSRRHAALVMSAAAILFVSTIAMIVSTGLVLSAYQRESAASSSAEQNFHESERQRRLAEANLQEAQSQRQIAEQHSMELQRATYVSNMRFAFRQRNQGLLHDARTLLDLQTPAEGLVDQRGLEWHALNAQVGSRYQTIGLHEGLVADIDFFPDGRTFATAGEDGAVRVWDADSLSLVREFRLQEAPIYTVGISPDGRWLAYGAGSREDPELKPVTLLDARTGVPLATLNRHDTTIRQVRFSPDGRYLASGSLQEKVSIWEFAVGVNGHSWDLTEPYSMPENFVIQFLDSRQLLTEFHKRKGYRVWDVQTGDAIHDYPDLADRNVEALSCCAQQSVLAYSEWHGHKVRFLDTRTGRRLGEIKASAVITTLELSPRGDTICAGTENGQIISLKLSFHGEGSSRRVQVDCRETLQVHHGTVSRLRFLDERRVISGGVDGRVVVFQLGPVTQSESPFGGHERGIVTQMAASPRNNLMAWSGMDGGVRLADRTSGRVLANSALLHEPAIELAWSGDGTHLAGISRSGRFGCWRVEDDSLVDCLSSSLHDFATPVAGLALSHHGATLYIAGDRGADGIHVWDVRRQTQVDFLPTLYTVRRLLVSPDDRLLIAAGEGIFVFDRKTNSQQHHLQTGGVCASLCFAPGGRTLAAGYLDGVVRLWDPEQGTAQRILPEDDRKDDMASVLLFSDDGRSLVAGDNGGRLRFWNTATYDYLGAMSIRSTLGILAMSQTPRGDAIDFTLGGRASDLSKRRFSRISLRVAGDPAFSARELADVSKKPSGTVEILEPSESRQRVNQEE